MQLNVRGTTPVDGQLSQPQLSWLRDMGFAKPFILSDESCYLRNKHCQLNTLVHCAENPGAEIVNGWVLWASPFIAELEFHSVVRIDGKLIDVTKRIDGEKTIWFFEDTKRWGKFHGNTMLMYENIVFPKMGINKTLIPCFQGIDGIFNNFAIKGVPTFTAQQKNCLADCKTILLD